MRHMCKRRVRTQTPRWLCHDERRLRDRARNEYFGQFAVYKSDLRSGPIDCFQATIRVPRAVADGSSTNGEKPTAAGSFAADIRHCRPSGCFVSLN